MFCGGERMLCSGGDRSSSECFTVGETALRANVLQWGRPLFERELLGRLYCYYCYYYGYFARGTRLALDPRSGKLRRPHPQRHHRGQELHGHALGHPAGDERPREGAFTSSRSNSSSSSSSSTDMSSRSHSSSQPPSLDIFRYMYFYTYLLQCLDLHVKMMSLDNVCTHIYCTCGVFPEMRV